ncbi:MAG: hypothetical protein KAI94_08090 [Anaerolineales bacterium]|jgi:hypothetical protein|nr:hypothetical protein [Anaerolineales bacterium]
MAYFFLLVHLVMVVVFSMLLDKKTSLSKNLAMYFGFVLVGVVFGVVTSLMSSQDVRQFLNPIGTGIADWFYNNWDPALHDPTSQRDPIIPWIMRYPQNYIFASVLAYALLGTLIWVSSAINRLDPTRRLMHAVPDFDDLDDEDESEPQPQSEASPE